MSDSLTLLKKTLDRPAVATDWDARRDLQEAVELIRQGKNREAAALLKTTLQGMNALTGDMAAYVGVRTVIEVLDRVDEMTRQLDVVAAGQKKINESLKNAQQRPEPFNLAERQRELWGY